MLNQGKEVAGVLIASIIVLAYIGIGFISVITQSFLGVEAKFPPDWSSAMLSLASAALGFLIGKVNSGTQGSGIVTQTVLADDVATTTTSPAGGLPSGMKRPPVPPEIQPNGTK